MKSIRKNLWIIVFAICLAAFTVYISLDTFVFEKQYDTDASGKNMAMFETLTASDSAAAETAAGQTGSKSSGKTEVKNGRWSGGRTKPGSSFSVPGSDTGTAYSYTSDSTWQDENVTITLSNCTEHNTQVYVADVRLTSAQYLLTAFADNTYGRNVTATTSEIAKSNDAVFAVNGDYYGAQEKGYVIRNGIVYRSTAKGSDIVCIYADGSLDIVNDRDYTAEQLVENGVWQAFTFGPALLKNGETVVTESSEVGKGMASNPRTAIGIIDANHFVFVVSDGRTDESEGLTLYELAQFMQEMGVKAAYNLDGGGSSTMYFNGQVVNKPTTSGTIREREVSDIVYIGKTA